MTDALSRPHTLLADVAQISLAAELADGASAHLVLEAVGADEIGVMSVSRIASALGGGGAAETAVTRATDMLTSPKSLLIKGLDGQLGWNRIDLAAARRVALAHEGGPW